MDKVRNPSNTEYYSFIRQEGLRKIRKYLSQDSWCPCQHSNPSSLELKSTVLPLDESVLQLIVIYKPQYVFFHYIAFFKYFNLKLNNPLRTVPSVLFGGIISQENTFR
jgi:hypothetical protein